MTDGPLPRHAHELAAPLEAGTSGTHGAEALPLVLQASGAVADVIHAHDMDTLRLLAAGQLPEGWDPRFAEHSGVMAIAANEFLTKGDRNTTIVDGVNVHVDDAREAEQRRAYAQSGGGSENGVAGSLLAGVEKVAVAPADDHLDAMGATAMDGILARLRSASTTNEAQPGASEPAAPAPLPKRPVAAPAPHGEATQIIAWRPQQQDPAGEATQIIKRPAHLGDVTQKITPPAAEADAETRRLPRSAIASVLGRTGTGGRHRRRVGEGERVIFTDARDTNLPGAGDAATQRLNVNSGAGEQTVVINAPHSEKTGEKTVVINGGGRHAEAEKTTPLQRPVRLGEFPEPASHPDPDATAVLRASLHAIGERTGLVDPDASPGENTVMITTAGSESTRRIAPVVGEVTQIIPGQMPRNFNQ
ncbi:MAG TPA: hypothetical protein VLF62_00935 [Candidatus Saccharimonadales bacterium]|nr:hypothetical protein [Candidatus Saccharimonadales bacterium]